MPADDLILNVKQIAGFPTALRVGLNDVLLIQRGGLGGPYLEMSPAALVGSALANGGDMNVGGTLLAAAIQAGSGQLSNLAVGMFTAQRSCLVEADAKWLTISGLPVATQTFVQQLIASVRASSVWSINGRTGDIRLTIFDVAGAAPLYSPRFEGQPRAPTPGRGSCSTRIATTAFVQGTVAAYVCALLAEGEFVTSFNGRTGAVTLEPADIPPLPYASIDSPNFTGYPTAPTAAQGTSTGQIATTAFVMAAVADSVTGVASFNTRTGNVTLESADITAAGGALLTSPAFAGTPTAPTAALGTSNNQLASTAFVNNSIAQAGLAYAPIASPTFTGTPSGPTAPVNTNTTQLATTAFVMAQINAIDAGVVSFNGRSGSVTLLANDVSAVGGVINPNASLTGTPTAPTASAGTNSTQIATTAFVTAAIAALTGVASFNGRTGAVALTSTDVNNAGGPYVPFSGGTMTGILGLLGVTDGSLGVAGQVGEYISSNVTGAPLTSGVAGALLVLNLTAGDWDVDAQLGVSTTGVLAYVGGNINQTAPATTLASYFFPGGGQAGTQQGIGMVRVIVSAPTQLQLTISGLSFTGTGVGSASMQARRRR